MANLPRVVLKDAQTDQAVERLRQALTAPPPDAIFLGADKAFGFILSSFDPTEPPGIPAGIGSICFLRGTLRTFRKEGEDSVTGWKEFTL